jgi:hypothetical protein
MKKLLFFILMAGTLMSCQNFFVDGETVELDGKWYVQKGYVSLLDSSLKLIERKEYRDQKEEYYLEFQNGRVFFKVPDKKVDVYFYKYDRRNREILLTRVKFDKKKFARVMRVSEFSHLSSGDLDVIITFPAPDGNGKIQYNMECRKYYPPDIEIQI